MSLQNKALVNLPANKLTYMREEIERNRTIFWERLCNPEWAFGEPNTEWNSRYFKNHLNQFSGNEVKAFRKYLMTTLFDEKFKPIFIDAMVNDDVNHINYTTGDEVRKTVVGDNCELMKDFYNQALVMILALRVESA